MLFSLISRLRLSLRRLFPWRSRYQIGRFEIQLTRDHSLPEYQLRFPTYDRFLPKLCKNLPDGSVVVDVGANVGDTIAAIASENLDLRFLAIEPDPEFSALLVQNLLQMRKVFPRLDVEIVRAFIGENLNVISSKGARGTRHAIVSGDADQSTNTLRLDEVLRGEIIEQSSLIKVDTDGFDWSIINSGFEIISDKRPLLFFECDMSNHINQQSNYAKLIYDLAEIGYNRFFIFDNFGGLVGGFSNYEDVINFFQYIEFQNRNIFKRTMHYIDILAATEENIEYAQVGIEDYKKSLLI